MGSFFCEIWLILDYLPPKLQFCSFPEQSKPHQLHLQESDKIPEEKNGVFRQPLKRFMSVCMYVCMYKCSINITDK